MRACWHAAAQNTGLCVLRVYTQARHQTRSSSGLSPSELTRLRDECRGIIEDRLTLALTGCAGYGLDERD